MRYSNTMIEVDTAKGLQGISLETRLLMRRRIFLTGEIDMEMANDFVQQMMYLDREGEEIRIYLNSCGGEVDAGLVIYDMMQAAESSISVCCVGHAYSMAAILLAAAPKGQRLILPHSKVMIHEPLIAGGIGGSASSIKKVSDSIMETRKLTVELLMKHTGQKKEDLEQALSFDNYMNAEEAIAFGLCDRIINAPERMREE
ncbi:MAG: ATP-dependent Clp protease proteolytic subunit [Eubacterium sp.]|nr:ATP-dependent Clp protease proteolytic subunit [Eubacterium sp.]